MLFFTSIFSYKTARRVSCKRDAARRSTFFSTYYLFAGILSICSHTGPLEGKTVFPAETGKLEGKEPIVFTAGFPADMEMLEVTALSAFTVSAADARRLEAIKPDVHVFALSAVK